jgi:hypothetical protein
MTSLLRHYYIKFVLICYQPYKMYFQLVLNYVEKIDVL